MAKRRPVCRLSDVEKPFDQQHAGGFEVCRTKKSWGESKSDDLCMSGRLALRTGHRCQGCSVKFVACAAYHTKPSVQDLHLGSLESIAVPDRPFVTEIALFKRLYQAFSCTFISKPDEIRARHPGLLSKAKCLTTDGVLWTQEMRSDVLNLGVATLIRSSVVRDASG
jgi:hypothetical protein